MEKINGRKLSLIFIFILILLVIALLVGKFTYSYLGPTISDDLETQGEVTASGDTLIFTKGNNLSLSATTDNFTTGGTNLTSTTNPKVKLVASTKTNQANATYYVGVLIKNNTYVYTTSGNTPELILTIKDEKGNNVTSGVDSLTYVTSGGVSGFDVTGKTGLFNIKTDYPISTTSSSAGTTHTWTFTLTFVNLGTDQSDNENASMNVDIYLQKEEYKLPLNEYVISQYTGTQGENSLYYHNSSLTNGAGDNSYRYAGGDYVLTEAGKSTGATMMIGYNNTVTTALIDFYCDGTKQYVGYNCDSTKAHYYLVKNDTTQYQTYNEVISTAIKKGYLTGDNVKNFVCFGTDAKTCSTENLYRIIGVINGKVKLIKWDYAKSSLLGTDGNFSKEYNTKYFSGELGESPASNSFYIWNNASTNTWNTSLLNKINLNTNFINNIGSTWALKISMTTWQVGGNTFAKIAQSAMNTAYQNEINTPSVNTTYDAKVGLMYVSDYGYAANLMYWAYMGYNTNYSKSYGAAKGENWLYGGGWDWTTSKNTSLTNGAFVLSYVGIVGNDDVSSGNGVRPVFNLESTVTYVSGSGTQSDPIRVA